MSEQASTLTDIIDRLRIWPAADGKDGLSSTYVEALMREAADELERLALAPPHPPAGQLVDRGRPACGQGDEWGNKPTDFRDGDPLVNELVWEVDRAVKQAGGTKPYDTAIRHILNKHSPAVDLTNHHNALKCPYCNPDGLTSEPAGNAAVARVPKVRTSHHRNKEEAARLQELVDKRYTPVTSTECGDDR